jgi:hypothetical protein
MLDVAPEHSIASRIVDSEAEPSRTGDDVEIVRSQARLKAPTLFRKCRSGILTGHRIDQLFTGHRVTAVAEGEHDSVAREVHHAVSRCAAEVIRRGNCGYSSGKEEGREES